MVMVDLINPNDFRIRTGIYPKVINIGNTNSRIVVINDFFLYPDKVREYALNCKYFKDPEIPMNPGYINYFGFNEIQVLKLTGMLKESFMGDFRTSHSAFAPVVSLQMYKEIGTLMPHVDYFHYAGICPLNIDYSHGEKSSGTHFYRYKKTGEEYTALANYRHKEILDSELDDWEVYHTQYHKYNQYIFYESALFHSAHWDKSTWNSDEARLTFNTFTW